MGASARDHKQSITQDVEDSVKLYLKEISRVPLLTPAREVELAERIAAGDEVALCTMVESNLRLVVRVAAAYRSAELPFLDLIQEGNLGLLRAARKFDHRLGYRFSTYAIWWIRQAITRAIYNKGKTIRVPVHAAEILAHWRREELNDALHDGQTPEFQQTCQSSAKIIELTRRVQQPLSLDRCVSDMMLADTLADENAESPSEVAEIGQLRGQLRRLLEQLSERERTVIEMRYGLYGGYQRSLKEVATVLGLSGERIRQLETAALLKLRRASAHTDLHAYLE